MGPDRHDDIFLALGRLQTAAEENTRQHERLFGKIDEISASVRCLPRLAERVSAIEPHIDDWKRAKQRGLGILAAVSLIGGVLGGAIKDGGKAVRAWFGF